MLIARDKKKLEATWQQVPGEGHLALPCDVTISRDVSTTIDEAARQLGPLDTVVHAAGAHAMTPLRSLKSTTVTELFDVNVTSALSLAKAFRRPAVRADTASIVLLSSAIGMVGGSGVSAYAASKAAVASLAKSLALELSAEHIRVNAVAAGIVSTPLTEEIKGRVGANAWNRIVESHPMGIGSPEDVAEAVLFLASSSAKWITGSVLAVDGGYTAQ